MHLAGGTTPANIRHQLASQPASQTCRQTVRKTDRQADRQADRQTDMECEERHDVGTIITSCIIRVPLFNGRQYGFIANIAASNCLRAYAEAIRLHCGESDDLSVI